MNGTRKSKTIGVLSTEDEDVRSLRELITYGLSLSAYTDCANVLLHEDEDVDLFIQKLWRNFERFLGVPELVELTLATGEAGVKGMCSIGCSQHRNLRQSRNY